MSTVAGRKPQKATGADLARWAFFFGAAGLVLLVAGFSWLPFGSDLGVLAALASVVYAARALRRPRAPRDTAMALGGAVLALLPLLAYLFLILAFAFGSGD